jgi:hypothetical protein
MLGQTCWSGRSSVADLSPAAQAVLDAADSAFEQAGTTRQGIAAAAHLGSCNASTELLAIAFELEGQ